jgi:hypothetical protein
MMTNDEAEQEELEAQLRTTMEGLQRAVMRLFQDGEVHPHLVVLALARVTGEVGAGVALAGGQDPEELLADLAGVVRQAGREFHEELRLRPCRPRGTPEPDQWRRPALTAENSSDSRNCRLRYSRAKRRRSRCNLSRVSVLPVWAGCRATSRSACAISASIWTRAR